MKILPNGYFSQIWDSAVLKKGLRASAFQNRNLFGMVECTGAIGRDGVLQALDALAVSDVFDSEDIVLDDFPFPQLIITERLLLVCNRTSILELQGITLTTVISDLPEGGKWVYATAHEYAYLTNRAVVVVRDPMSRTWSINSGLPKAGALCNFNGQLFVGNSLW